jgi:hypothetical protein
LSSTGATVVQFGLGHQIANLVTRVQIPAVASYIYIIIIRIRTNRCKQYTLKTMATIHVSAGVHYRK